MLANSGEITPPCGVPATVRCDRPVVHHTRIQPQPDQLEHPPIRHAPPDLDQQPVLVDLAEEVPDVGLDDRTCRPRGNPTRIISSASVATALRAEPVTTRQEVGLENRFQHQLRRLLRHPVAHRRDAQRPLRPSGLGISTRRTGAGRYMPARRSSRKFRQHPLDAVVLHRGQGHPIDPGRTTIRSHPLPRLHQDVTPADPVDTGRGNADPQTAWPQPIACVGVLALCPTGGKPVQLDGPRLPAGVVGPGGPGHALTLTSTTSTTEVGALPSRRVMLHADHRYYDPVGLPLPSARLHHRLIRAVFARRRPGRRVSPVPHQTVITCRSPYPGGTRQLTPEQGPTDMAFAVT